MSRRVTQVDHGSTRVIVDGGHVVVWRHNSRTGASSYERLLPREAVRLALELIVAAAMSRSWQNDRGYEWTR